jgi:hypothetical protein
MTVLGNYALYSFKQTKLVESLLCEVQAATSKQEFLWKLSLAQKNIEEFNERGKQRNSRSGVW